MSLRILALVSLVAAASAHAQVPQIELLAPTLSEFNAEFERLERRVDAADAVAAALFRVHNAFAEHRGDDELWPACDEPWFADLAPRARLLGPALRDRAQSARVQSAHVRRLRSAATVEPLIDGAMAARIDALAARIARLEATYLEAAEWHARHVVPLTKRCELELRPGAGLDVALPRATAASPIAVLAVGDGLVCPAGIRAPAVVLVKDGLACYGAADCSCEPAPVPPAAVLGPEIASE